MNIKFYLIVITLLLAILIVLLIWQDPFGWGIWNRIFYLQNPVTCTIEAKQCPDGSYVIRHGPNCEFTPCVEVKEPVVGGDKDSHGCIGSAGYTWCQVKQKCLRVWEEKCE